MDQSKRPPTFKERWAASRPTKTVVFWSWLGIGILTMIVGFTWGGWVTGSTARAMAEARGEDAVAKRLAPMCALRFENAADKGQKLQELKERYAALGGRISHLDGISVDFDDWHFNVRPSNTEPLLRLNLEALDEGAMEHRRDEVLDLIRT